MKYKLILYPDTFLWVKNNKGLLYNAKFFTILDFTLNPNIRHICEHLLNYDNLYCILIDNTTIDNPCKEFVQQIVKNKLGEIFNENASVISLPPLLNIQFDIDKLLKDDNRDIGENILSYLHTINIYSGGQCSDKQYFKQIIYPVNSLHQNRLLPEQIHTFLKTNMTPYIRKINITVSDIENYDIESVLELLTEYKNSVIFHILCPTINVEYTVILKIIASGYKVNLICELSPNQEENDSLMQWICSEEMKHNNISNHFIIKNEEEYKFWLDFINEHKIKNYQFSLIYDGNDEFFHANIFLTKADIEDCQLSRREVFAHMTVNTLLFGSLSIMPNGEIFTNINSKSIGNVDDSIYDIIIRELEQNHGWRKIRNSIRCDNCLYQWLCPSPSYYEHAMSVDTVCTNILFSSN